MDTLIRPFGIFLRFLYDLTGNYGWALLIFTIVVNLALMPLNFKQQKSTIAMQKIQPKMTEIQKKYQYDQEKQSQEMMKLYKEYNINPLSGCLPMLIQLPIILILYQAVLKPLTYMFGPSQGFTPEVINSLLDTGKTILGKASISEMQLFGIVDKLGDLWPAGAEVINFNFFGLPLEQTASFSTPSVLWIIPILCGVTTYVSTMITTKLASSGKDKTADDPTANSMKTMQTFMPIMTAFIAFSLPAALGFYWTVGNIVRMLQQIYMNFHMKKLAEAELENEVEQGTVHPAKKKKKGRK